MRQHKNRGNGRIRAFLFGAIAMASLQFLMSAPWKTFQPHMIKPAHADVLQDNCSFEYYAPFDGSAEDHA